MFDYMFSIDEVEEMVGEIQAPQKMVCADCKKEITGNYALGRWSNGKICMTCYSSYPADYKLKVNDSLKLSFVKYTKPTGNINIQQVEW